MKFIPKELKKLKGKQFRFKELRRLKTLKEDGLVCTILGYARHHGEYVLIASVPWGDDEEAEDYINKEDFLKMEEVL